MLENRLPFPNRQTNTVSIHAAKTLDESMTTPIQQQAVPVFVIFDDYRPTVTITVLIRWLLLFAWLAMTNYQQEHDSDWVAFNLLGAALGVANAHLTWRIVTRCPIAWHHALVLSLLELVVITAGLYTLNGFQNRFYVFYYPAMLGFSLMFPRWVSFGMLAAVIFLYVVMALTVSPTLSVAAYQEKVLFVRVITMGGIVAAGTMLMGWERARRREAVAAERRRSEENLELQRKTQVAELAALEERSRIAREIHDGVAQSIYMLSLQLETCADLAEQQRPGLSDRLEQLVALSRQSLLEVRHYVFDLKPYLAGEKSAAGIVESQVRECGSVAGAEAEVEVEGEDREVPMVVSTCLYRATQEALANVFKHARASQVKVALEFSTDGVHLQVRDNGHGFDPDTGIPGNGLRNMRQRAEELGGSFSLESAPGQGSSVTIRVPC